MTQFKIINDDCLVALKGMEDNSVDSIVTDPPAGISFMGKEWDHHKGGRDEWIKWMTGVATECLRVLKPGGHALVWSIPRTSHWTAIAWEDAGLEIRDRIAHCFGSGFPKSANVSKMIDKSLGAEREVVGVNPNSRPNMVRVVAAVLNPRVDAPITAPATEAAKQWEGWGTALKPATEDWWLMRKPLSEKTIAANVLAHGTGALNIDSCRVGTEQTTTQEKQGQYGAGSAEKMREQGFRPYKTDNRYQPAKINPPGRWPSNFIHDGSDEVVALFPETKNGGQNATTEGAGSSMFGIGASRGAGATNHAGDSGSAARFFKACPDDDAEDTEARRLIYCAKASRADRNEGCDKLPTKKSGALNMRTDSHSEKNEMTTAPASNNHPTVKATSLMRYLCRLITPPNGTVLDPFAGSGSTGKGAIMEGFKFIGIEQDPDYAAIAEARCAFAENNTERQGKLL